MIKENKKVKKYVIPIFLVGILLGIGMLSNTHKGHTLTISVASSMTEVMEAIEEAFASQYQDVTLHFNFGGSGALTQQIEQGAPVDVFLAAGPVEVLRLEERGKVQSSVPLVTNKLVLIGNSTYQSDNEEIKVLGEGEKLAVGDFDSVPVGYYAKEALVYSDMLEVVSPHLVFGKDVREVLFWVEQGHADLGIVYSSDLLGRSALKVLKEIPSTWHSPIVYTANIIDGSEQTVWAQHFVDFLQSQEVEAIWEAYGFVPY